MSAVIPFPNSAQREYTYVPDEYFVEMPHKCIGIVQYWFLGYLMALTGQTPYTFRWSDPLPIATIVKHAGSRANLRSIRMAIADGVERGLIAKKRDGRYWRYKVLHDNWA